MKNIINTCILSLITGWINGQILFSDKFNTLTLQTDVQTIGSITVSTTYTTIPTGYDIINDGYKNNIGTNNAPNKPFNVATLKTTGWAITDNTIEKDTFLVTTSWLDSIASTKRFVISPVISGITANSVLSWEAKSPDPNFPEGYEVYITTNTSGTLTSTDFPISNRVFYLADGNVTGGGEKSIWTKRGLSLAAFAGQNIRIAFKNISNNMYQLWLDDIQVENISNAYDAELTEGQGIYKYNAINTNGNINCRVTNKGNTIINAVTLNYSIKGPANYNYTQAFSLSQALAPFSFADLTFNLPYNISNAGFYQVKVWVNYVNGNADQNNLNDTIYSKLSIITVPPQKKVMVEQFLSTDDGYSPDGQEKLNSLISTTVIAVNIHENDSLYNSSASGIISAYRKKTTSALIDRNYFSDLNALAIERAAYATKINSRKSAIVPASISVVNKNYNSTTRELTFTVQVDFAAEVMGDYRINTYITENNVAGIGSDTTFNGWNQLSFMYNTPWSPYFQKGYYLASKGGHVMKAWEYYHQHVLDTVLDGAFGASGIIPMTGGTLNQSYAKVYTYTVPTQVSGVMKFNPDNLYIVANVSEYDSDLNKRTILNCTESKVTSNSELVGIKESPTLHKFKLFPNPSYGLTNVLIPEFTFKNNLQISIKDILGQEVYHEESSMKFGLLQLNLYPFSNGTYFLSISDGIITQTQKLIIQK